MTEGAKPKKLAAAKPRKPGTPKATPAASAKAKAVAAEAAVSEAAPAGPTIDPEHPRPGQPPMPADPGKTCANCGTPLLGHYCHECGQQGHLHNKLGHLLHEFVEGIAHFDGRLWRTLPLLAWNPGRLSRDWIEGKRARYVAPLHIFLFALFLMFTIPTFVHYPGTVTVNGVKYERNEQNREILMKQERDKLAAMKAKPRESVDKADAFAMNASDFVMKKAEHADYYILKIKSLLYKFGFLFVPISVAILWLVLFYKRGYTLYDHATVALYGLGFTALLVSGALLLPPAISEIWTFAAMIFVPFHSIRHLKVAYAMGWPGAIATGLVMGVLTLIGLLLFVLAIIGAGVFLG
jgi:hypothetical protein